MAVDMMLTPGAVISGLRPLSPMRGPPGVKLANPVKLGLVMDAAATAVAVRSAAARSFAPSDEAVVAGPFTPRNGIVTLKGTPSSGLAVIGPSNGGKPAALFTITTTAAPACWPKMAFATRAQTPRFTTAIVLGGSGPPKAATLQPSDSLPAPALIPLMLKMDEPDSAKPLASIAGIVVPEKVTVAPGKVGYGSFAATEMAPSAVGGEAVVYGVKPPLSADASTTTPAPAGV